MKKSTTRKQATKPDRTTVSKTISIPTPVYDAAKNRMREEQRSLSNYIALLIQRDAASV